jgi:hypothetical protein
MSLRLSRSPRPPRFGRRALSGCAEPVPTAARPRKPRKSARAGARAACSCSRVVECPTNPTRSSLVFRPPRPRCAPGVRPLATMRIPRRRRAQRTKSERRSTPGSATFAAWVVALPLLKPRSGAPPLPEAGKSRAVARSRRRSGAPCGSAGRARRPRSSGLGSASESDARTCAAFDR